MPAAPDHHDPYTMSFGDHLEELRKRLLLALAAPLPLFIVLFFLSDTLLQWMLLPVFDALRANDLPASVQALSPPEVLATQLKLSLIGALVLTAPWVLYQIWLFVAPGLYAKERRFVYFLLPGSALLTVAGATLLYFVMLPLMLHVLIAFAKGVDTRPPGPPPAVQAAIDAWGDREVPLRLHAPDPATLEAGSLWHELDRDRTFVAVDDGEGGLLVEEVISAPGRIEQSFRVIWAVNFALLLLLATVIAFQMPLVIVLLGWMGLVSGPWLRAHRRYALGVCGILAAVITPADAASMLMMLVPLYGLYELGIILLAVFPAARVAEGGWSWRRWWRRGIRTRQPAEPAQPGATVPRSKRPAQPTSHHDDGDSDG